MKHDRIATPGIDRATRWRTAGNRFDYFRPPGCGRLRFWIRSLVAAWLVIGGLYGSQTQILTQYGNDTLAGYRFFTPVKITNNRTVATEWSKNGYSWFSLAPGATVYAYPAATAYDPTNLSQQATWSGLTSGGTVTGNVAAKSVTLYYRLTSGGPTQSLPVNLAGFSPSVKHSTTPGNNWENLPEQTMTIAADGTASVAGPTTRKEIFLLLLNNTGVKQTIAWGSQMLELAPGANELRYDGPVDSNGIPTVAPDDLQATLFDRNGSSYLMANLDLGVENTVKWGLPPTAPGETQQSGSPWSEVLSETGSNGGPTIAVHYPSGAVGIYGTAAKTAQTASNTTGETATLSDPTKAKPAQTSGNTVTNITNNNINNTSTSKANIVNLDGTSDTAEQIDVGGPVGSGPGKLIPIDDLKNDLEGVAGDGSVLLPSTSLKTAGQNSMAGAESFAQRLAGWSPLQNVGGLSGDLTSLQIRLPGGIVSTAQLPLSNEAIGWFRSACLFALYLGSVFKVLHILKI